MLAPSLLAKPVQELIRTIFDVESMKKAMVEFEVGTELVDSVCVGFSQCVFLSKCDPHSPLLFLFIVFPVRLTSRRCRWGS